MDTRYINDGVREEIVVMRDGNNDRVGRRGDSSERLCIPTGMSDEVLKLCMWCYERGATYGAGKGRHDLQTEIKRALGIY